MNNIPRNSHKYDKDTMKSEEVGGHLLLFVSVCARRHDIQVPACFALKALSEQRVDTFDKMLIHVRFDVFIKL